MIQDDPDGAGARSAAAAVHLMRPEQLPRRADEAAQLLGAAGCRTYLVARDRRSLVPVGDEDGEEALSSFE